MPKQEKKIPSVDLCSPAKSHTSSSQNKQERMAAWRDNDTGTNRRNPNRGDGDSPGQRQGRGKTGFCPLPVCGRREGFPVQGFHCCQGYMEGGGAYRCTSPFTDVHHLWGTHLRTQHAWVGTHLGTPNTTLQQRPTASRQGPTPAPLCHGCTPGTPGHRAAAGTHTPAPRRAHPRHPRPAGTHGTRVDAHASGTHGRAPMG